MVRRRVVVHGMVQGVFFRDSVRERARARDVSGWVRNNRDGTVEAVFEGEPDAVRALVEWAGAGPRGAEVESVDETGEEPQGLSRFEIR
jgi:acylphosphatase